MGLWRDSKEIASGVFKGTMVALAMLFLRFLALIGIALAIVLIFWVMYKIGTSINN